MENASKALIIAGSILISILIIALGMYIFAQSSGSTDDSTLSTLQIQQFNGKFDRYKGRQTGVQVSALLDNLNSNAIGKTKKGEKPNIVFCPEDWKYQLTDGTGTSGGKTIENDLKIPDNNNPKGYVKGSSDALYRIAADASEDTYRKGIRDIRYELESSHNYYVYMGTNDKTDLIHSIIICYRQTQAGETSAMCQKIADETAKSNNLSKSSFN